MSEIKGIPENIDDKLFTLKYNCGEETHLKPDPEYCKKCKGKNCTYFCPANVYEWNEEDQKLNVGFENCLECGACRIGCPTQSIEWNYPEGGKGVTFKCG